VRRIIPLVVLATLLVAACVPVAPVPAPAATEAATVTVYKSPT
jgi:hypothetical protein